MAAEPDAPASAPDKVAGPASLRTLLAPAVALALAVLALALREQGHLAAYRGRIFQLLFARNEPAGAALLVVLVLVAAAGGRWLPVAVHELPARLGNRRATAAVALGAVVVLLAGALLVYGARPLAMDEYAPWFQARVFAAGHLTGHFPPDLLARLVPPKLLFPFFAVDPITGSVASTYWPGFALLLTPLTWLGAPWLMNPLLGGSCLLLIASLARRLTGDDAAAGWALLLTLASPAFTIDSISFYPLTAHLALNLVWMTLLVEGDSVPERGPRLTGRPARLLAAGGVGSLALVLANPVPHTAFALAWLPALLRRRGWRAGAWLGIGYVPLALALGLAWLPVRMGLQTGGAVRAAGDAGGTLLSSAARLALNAFSWPSASLLHARLLALGELVTWAAPLLPVLALFGWGATRRGSPLRLLAASATLTLALYVFVPFDQGHGWGYRYFHPAFAALPLLGAAALVNRRASNWRATVLAATLLAVPLANGLRAWQVAGFIAEHRTQLPPLPPEGRALCFVSLGGGSYRVDLLQNDPFLRDRVTYLASAGFDADVALVALRFPGASLHARTTSGSAWSLAAPVADSSKPR
jgi:hypothetical protein